MLDEKDIMPDAYILEVSSPGIDRVLRKPRDLEREQGKAVDVTLYAPMDGKKNLTGVLTGFDGEKFTLDDEITIELSKAAQIRLHIDF
jgi:ribosome maturation factor RimP